MSETLLVGMLAGVTAALLFGADSGRRLARVARTRPRPPPGRGAVPATVRGRLAASALAGLAVAALVPAPAGAVVGVGVTVVTAHVLGRLEPRARRSRRRAVERDLPLALDLLSACALAGVAPRVAVAEVATALRGPLGDDLGTVVAAWEVGSSTEEAWGAVGGAGETPGLRALGRTFVRAEVAGVPLAGLLAARAADERASARSRAEVAARRVGVLAVAPLGLCFLPAFMLLAVVPLVVGLLDGVGI